MGKQRVWSAIALERVQGCIWTRNFRRQMSRYSEAFVSSHFRSLTHSLVAYFCFQPSFYAPKHTQDPSYRGTATRQAKEGYLEKKCVTCHQAYGSTCHKRVPRFRRALVTLCMISQLTWRHGVLSDREGKRRRARSRSSKSGAGSAAPHQLSRRRPVALVALRVCPLTSALGR